MVQSKSTVEMKKIWLLIVFLTFLPNVFSQDTIYSYNEYELKKDMPIYYRLMRERLTFPDAWGNSSISSFKKWRKHARKLLEESLQAVPPDTLFRYQITDTEQRRGYRAEKIKFNISFDVRIPAYLLIPEGDGPFPALVVLHDHGAKFSIGKEKNVRPFHVPDSILQESIKWVEKCYDGVYVGDFFASKGYVVLAIDALFWGERGRFEGINYNAQQALASNLFQLGTSWCGIITNNDIRSSEFLATLPFVDAERIGAVGFSIGAHRAWMLSAASDRIHATAAICWMNTTKYLMTLANNQNKGYSAYSTILPGLRNHLDYPHVASIICPKPLLVFNGARDKLFPLDGTRDAFDILRQVWDSQNVADKLDTRIWDTSHIFNREMQNEVLRFMDKYLKK